MDNNCSQTTCIQNERLRKLETNDAVTQVNIVHLVERLDGLTNVLTKISVLLGGTLITALIGVLGFLIPYWVKG